MSIRKGRHLFTAFTLILTLITALLVFNISQQLTKSVRNTYQYYDTIIGPAGSQIQLLMNSLFYADNPLGTVSYETYAELAEDPRVTTVIPVAAGDNYNSVPIIGTHSSFIADFPGEGRLWTEQYEVVLGYNTVRTTGLAIGDTFYSIHGLNARGHVHETAACTVVGILDKTQTAADNVIYCDIETVWAAHEHGDGEGGREELPDAASQTDAGIAMGLDIDPIENPWGLSVEDEVANMQEHEEEEGEQEEKAAIQGHTAESREAELTAILIKCKSIQDHMNLAAEYNSKPGLQAINPSVVMRGILDNINTTTKIAMVLCGVVMLMGVIVIINITMLNMYDMRADLKLMRLIGFPKWKVEAVVYFQILIVTLVVIGSGLLLSKALILPANAVLPEMGITLTAEWINPADLAISGIVLVLNMIPIICLTKISLAGGLIDEKS